MSANEEELSMPAFMISFTQIPQVGFAHHFYMEQYLQNHLKTENSIELVYIKSGYITAELFNRSFTIAPGSFFVLSRQQPYRLTAANQEPQSHCSIQLFADFTISLLEDGSEPPEHFHGLILPFITPPGKETEALKKALYTIVSELSLSREKHSFSAALSAGSLLSGLDMLYRQTMSMNKNTPSYWEYKIKHYVAEHIHESIPLTSLAAALGKTPNYLNYVFRTATGSTIHQYINREKVRIISELMEDREVSFPMACENVAILDLSCGHRMFKKYMGVTPGAYAGEKRHIGRSSGTQRTAQSPDI